MINAGLLYVMAAAGLLAVYWGYRSFRKARPEGLSLEGENEPDLAAPVEISSSGILGSPSRRTWTLLIAMILVYGALTFWNLGSRKSPQTFWASRTDAVAVLDLGTEQQLQKVHYFNGLGAGTYALSASSDGLVWGAESTFSNDNPFAEFRWRSVELSLKGRYLRIRNVKGQMELLELFFGPGIQPRILSSSPEGAQALCDEANTFVPGASFYDGMYFDEIYHARTGYEYRRGIDASETTHPPLGKLLISWGIALFGMNPFGYRFMGALAGILMLPAVFGLGRRLAGRDEAGLLATAFFALDFMHFTQTRIATIDGFAVLFILWAYYCLLRYFQTPPGDEDQGQATGWLFASGLSIGLGMASKWISIYAASGMLALYAWDLFFRPRRWAIRNSCLGLGAFVVVPVLLYLAAYIPYLGIPGRTLSDVITSQKGMWDYHAHLKATHPFSSQWYEWPLMKRPIWYFSGANAASGTISSIEAFGNPVVWYGGSLCFLWLMGRYLVAGFRLLRARWNLARKPKPSKKVQKSSPKRTQKKPKSPKRLDSPQTVWVWTPMRSWTFLLLGGLAQFLPWVVIPRKLVFIYHFFATVPFLVLAMCLELEAWREFLARKKAWAYLPWGLVGCALLCFGVCYPVLSGAVVPRAWGVFIQKVFYGIYF